MIHQMKLNPEPFFSVKSGRKTIELRLNDEKRQKIQTGDFIQFSRTDNPDDKIQVRVTALHCFNSFHELFEKLPKNKLGYSDDESPDSEHMNLYYSKEEQKKYNALGIEIRMTDLQKFIDAHEKGYKLASDYKTALSEIRKGKKTSHWMWYIFPQIQGLGFSSTTIYFSIRDLQEAIDYYQHPVLGAELLEITRELLKLETNDPMVVFGCPDAYKMRSCMTLFKYAIPDEPLFQQILDKYCQGSEDDKTCKILDELEV